MKAGKMENVVSDDKNWRTLVKNERDCADQWQQDWGFLATGAQDPENANSLKIFTIDDKIRKVEEVNLSIISFIEIGIENLLKEKGRI